jgi:uncharacterized membrane protein
MGWLFVSQTRESFDERTASPHIEALFHSLQLSQSLLGITMHVAFFLLVRQHKRLQTRTFYMLGVLACIDLMFCIFLLITVVILPFVKGHPVPGGRPACQLYGAMVTFPLMLSLSTYCLVAYERKKALVTPLERLKSRQLLWLWLCVVVMCAIATTLPSFFGGYEVMPSGLYCIPDFKRVGTFVTVTLLVLTLLTTTVIFYWQIARHLRAMVHKSLERVSSGRLSAADAEEQERARRWARAAGMAVLRMAALPVFYVVRRYTLCAGRQRLS